MRGGCLDSEFEARPAGCERSGTPHALSDHMADFSAHTATIWASLPWVPMYAWAQGLLVSGCSPQPPGSLVYSSRYPTTQAVLYTGRAQRPFGELTSRPELPDVPSGLEDLGGAEMAKPGEIPTLASRFVLPVVEAARPTAAWLRSVFQLRMVQVGKLGKHLHEYTLHAFALGHHPM